MTIEIGRVVVKIAGRDAGKKGIIIDILGDNSVLVDGETRRRKVNILHIEPLSQTAKIEKNASHEDVAKVLDELGLKARTTKPKAKTQKPKAQRKTSEQLRTQKQEKKKLRGILAPKKKEAKEGTLEEKAGVEEKKEEKHEHTHEHKAEEKETLKKPTTKKVEKKEE